MKRLIGLDPIGSRVFNLLKLFRISDQTFLVLVAIIVGVVVGAGAYLFEKMLEYSSFFFWEFLPGLLGAHPVLAVLTPALGALLLAPFLIFFPKNASRDGVLATIEAVALQNGVMRWSNSVLRMCMSAITLGSGGSAGSNGPIIQIGSSLASGVGQLLREGGNRLRVIVACGAAAGVASIFNAPIAGVLFALEVVLGEFNVHSFSPIVIASVVATAMSRSISKSGNLLDVLPYSLNSPWEILLYALMGVVAGLVAVAFIRTMAFMEHFFRNKIPIKKYLKPALGGLLVGAMGYFFPQILGYSYDPFIEAIHGQVDLTLLGILVVLKIVATSFTLGSGGSGGILSPSLFLGAVLGSACGEVFQKFFPDIVVTPGAYGVVGMGAMLGAVVQAPMTAIIMVFELTNVYAVILPMMTACIVATMVQRGILQGSIYTLGLARSGLDIDAGREMGILLSLQVKDVMRSDHVKVPANAPYHVVLGHCLAHGGDYLYMVDENDNLEGVISFSDLKEFVFEEGFKDLVLAKDLANDSPVYVTPEESLASSLNKFSNIDVEQLPVVELSGDSLKLKGVITRSHLLNAYRQEMIKRQLIQDRRGSE